MGLDKKISEAGHLYSGLGMLTNDLHSSNLVTSCGHLCISYCPHNPAKKAVEEDCGWRNQQIRQSDMLMIRVYHDTVLTKFRPISTQDTDKSTKKMPNFAYTFMQRIFAKFTIFSASHLLASLGYDPLGCIDTAITFSSF